MLKPNMNVLLSPNICCRGIVGSSYIHFTVDNTLFFVVIDRPNEHIYHSVLSAIRQHMTDATNEKTSLFFSTFLNAFQFPISNSENYQHWLDGANLPSKTSRKLIIRFPLCCTLRMGHVPLIMRHPTIFLYMQTLATRANM